MGRGECIKLLVDDLTANPMLRNAKRERAWDCAGMYQCDPKVSDYEPDRAARFAARRQLRLSVPFFRTLLLHHPDCLEHTPRESGSMGTQPWEAPARIDHILQAIRADGVMGFKRHDLVLSTQFQVAPVEALLRVHTRRYIDFVRALDREVALNGAALPFTPKLQRMLQGSGAESVKDDRVSDTSFSVGSLRAAERAAGAVMHAVDQVLAGKQRNAFCCVRPPGHHAGQNGLLPGSESCGFCIFNNIAIGAMHALTAHALTVRRIAIVDIDVHHGNGTEEIVKSLSNHDQILFYSVHLCVRPYDYHWCATLEFYSP